MLHARTRGRLCFLWTLGLLVTSGLLCGQDSTPQAGAKPDSREFRIVGYMAGANLPHKEAVLATHLKHVTDINFAFANPTNDASGKIAEMKPAKRRLLAELVSQSHKLNKRVFISFGGWRGDDLGHDIVYEQIAADPVARKRFIDEILSFVEEFDLDGVDMDWEYPRLNTEEREYATEYARFISELADALHAEGKELTAAVIGCKDKETDDGDGDAYLDSVLQDFDYVHLMVYDYTDLHHANYQMAIDSLKYWIDERGLDPSKATLGMPIYARPRWIGFRTIVESYGDEHAELDYFKDESAGKEGGYNGIPTVKKKTQLAWDRELGGVMFWAMSSDIYSPEKLHLSILKNTFDHVEELRTGDRQSADE